MPELDPLPGRPRVPDFSPRTGDFAAVVSRAKGRRRRHLGTAAGAGLAGVAAVAALSMGGSGGTFGLEPVPPAASVVGGGEASPSPAESPSPEEQEPENGGPQETAAPEPGESQQPADPGAGPEPQPEPSAPVPGGDQDEEGYQPPPPRTERPAVTVDTVAWRTTGVCQSDPSLVTSTGWCVGYDGPTHVQIGEPATFRALACRPTGRGGGTLRFDTEQQVEFTVTNGQRREWHWSGGYQFPKNPTSVDVAEATCARWSVQWDGTGDDGDGLRPGTYAMQADILTAFSDGITWASSSNGGNVEVVE